MKRALLPVSALLLAVVAQAWADEPAAKAKQAKPNVPEGYKLLYSQTFDKPDSIGDFEFTTPEKWKWSVWDEKKPNGALECLGPGKYKPKVRSPLIIALISGRVFGDFVLEADLCQTGREYGHRDMCIFFGFTTPSKFYYVHMATKADKNAHNVFIVNDKPRTNIAKQTTKGVQWGSEKWHHVRLERNAKKGTITVFYDDMTKPIMRAEDKTFQTGLIGFGSFDDSGRVDNVKIWGPKVTETKESFFGKAGEKKSAGEKGK